jgi:hypothetical protein
MMGLDSQPNSILSSFLKGNEDKEPKSQDGWVKKMG